MLFEVYYANAKIHGHFFGQRSPVGPVLLLGYKLGFIYSSRKVITHDSQHFISYHSSYGPLQYRNQPKQCVSALPALFKLVQARITENQAVSARTGVSASFYILPRTLTQHAAGRS